MRWMLSAVFAVWAGLVSAAPGDAVFTNIDGGTHAMRSWAGQPVLVVNTASECGFTYQYDGLQALFDTYKSRGLIVLAVPSDDFNQELGSAAEVKEFCEISFGLELPMADITPVKGAGAHPFYRAVRAETGFVPKWNFNKVLIGPDGAVVATWGSNVKPESRQITRAIEALLD